MSTKLTSTKPSTSTRIAKSLPAPASAKTYTAPLTDPQIGLLVNHYQHKEQQAVLSRKLAQLWVTLDSLQHQLHSTVLPLCQHLGIHTQDPALVEALTHAAQTIEVFFYSFHLQADAFPPVPQSPPNPQPIS